MSHTFNEETLDALIRHQIGLLRFSGFVRNKIWRLLDATEADMRAQIANRLRRNAPGQITPANLRRMERLLVGLRETRIKAWRDVRETIFREMRAFARAEPAFEASILRTIVPVELGLTLPTAEALRSMVNTHPFQGATLSAHVAALRAADIRRIEQQIKIGMVQGETIPALGRRIVGTVALRGRNGVTEITRRNADIIVRTAVSGIGAAARALFALENVDLAPQEIFTATLDSRTTPICRAEDGNVYDVGTGPVFPLHMGERSLYTPILDGEAVGQRPIREFTQKGLVRDYTKANGLPLVSDRALLPHGHKGAFDAFARKRMRELTGTVPAKTTYTEFLNRQTSQFQDDILGPTRGKLFRSGGLTLDKFVDSTGKEIPLSELAKFEADAFTAAGLDPDKFTP